MITKISQALQSQQIVLSSRPDGVPTKDNFSLATAVLSPIGNGEILVRNLWMSVDPYMRGRMKASDSYVPAFEIDEALEGGCIGEVVESNNKHFHVGSKLIEHERCK